MPRHHRHSNHHTGSVDCSANWELASNGQVPPNAIPGGRDANGETYYIGRARHDEHFLIPGKVHPSHHGMYYPHHGEKHQNRYEVLVSRNPSQIFSWVPSSGRHIPVNAVEGGRQKHEPVYIGRHGHEGALVVGKVLPSHSRLYISYGGKEHHYKDYEILVLSYAAMPAAIPFNYAYNTNMAFPPSYAPAAPAASATGIYPSISAIYPPYASSSGFYASGYGAGGPPPPYSQNR